MRRETSHCLEAREVRVLVVDPPYITSPLVNCTLRYPLTVWDIILTWLFPATKQVPSDARVIDLIGMSPAGVYRPSKSIVLEYRIYLLIHVNRHYLSGPTA